MRFRKLAVASTLAAATLATTLGTVGLAQADAPHNGVCEYGEICFHWDSNLGGSFRDYVGQTPDFAGDTFVSSGAGQGQRVKNNSASAKNNWEIFARVYYNEWWSGPHDDVPAYSWRNLVNTWNDNASFYWGPVS